MKYPDGWEDYTLKEKICYIKGWNEAIIVATQSAKQNQYKNPYNMLKELRKLEYNGQI